MPVPDGSRVQCGDWRRPPRLPVRFRAGILRASLMRPRSAGFRNGVRRASGAPDAGSSSSHAVGAPVNTPSRARDGAAHPPSSGRSSLSRRVRLLPQSAGVTADDAFPAFAGLTPVIRRIMRRGARSPPAHCRPTRGTGAGPVGASRRIRGAGAPHRHTMTDNRGVTQGREHPVHRGPSGWMVACAGSGTPGRRPAGVTAARPPLWREVRVRIPRRAPTPIRSALRRPFFFPSPPRGRIDAPESGRIPG